MALVRGGGVPSVKLSILLLLSILSKGGTHA